MRHKAPVVTTSICLLIFLITPLLLSFPEDLVPIFIGCAFVSSVGLAFSHTPRERLTTFLATLASLVFALHLWQAGVSHLESHAQFWKNAAMNNTLKPAETATSRPTTNP